MMPHRGVRNVAKIRLGTRIHFEWVPRYPLNIQKLKSAIDAMTLLTNVCICLNLDGIAWLTWHLIEILLFCSMLFNMCTMVRLLRSSAISFTQQQQSPVSGRICWGLQSRHAATALQTAKLPRSYWTPVGPGHLPFPLHPLGPLHASRSNGWFNCWQLLVMCRPSLQLISGLAITTGEGLHVRLTEPRH